MGSYAHRKRIEAVFAFFAFKPSQGLGFGLRICLGLTTSVPSGRAAGRLNTGIGVPAGGLTAPDPGLLEVPVIEIDLTENVARVAAQLDDFARTQLRFAVARALTRTAAEFSQDELPNVLEAQLDRPTPFTKRAGRFIPARKDNLTAAVYIAPLQSRYLRYQVYGGTRIQKGFETKYESIADAIRNRRLVPTRRVRLNQYGNVSRAAIVRLGEAAQAKGDVFIGQPNGRGGKPRTFGVYERDKKTKALRALFVAPKNPPTYDDILKLRPSLEAYAGQTFDFHLNRSLEIALATARR